jgi:hypothetical protein
MASNGGAPENLMDLMDQAPAQPPGSSKKADKGTSKKSAPASSLSVDGVPPQAQLSKPAGATDAKKQKKVIFHHLDAGSYFRSKSACICRIHSITQRRSWKQSTARL